MAVKQILENALNTPISRKEFLGQVGALLLAVIGVTSILHVLGGTSHQLGLERQAASRGYGSSVYGGRRRI